MKKIILTTIITNVIFLQKKMFQFLITKKRNIKLDLLINNGIGVYGHLKNRKEIKRSSYENKFARYN